MGCVVLMDDYGAVDWIMWMYGIGFGICWAIGDGDSAGRWNFGRGRWIGAGGVWPYSVCAIVFVGCAPCRGMHLGWRQWGIRIAPFVRHLVGFGTLAWLQIGMGGMGLEYGLGVNHGRRNMGDGGIVFVAR